MRRAALLAAAVLTAALAVAPLAPAAGAQPTRDPSPHAGAQSGRPLGQGRPAPSGRHTPAALTHGHARPGAAAHRPARPAGSPSAPGGLDPATELLPASDRGSVTVAVSGRRTAVAAQARRLGGRVLSSADGASSVLIAQRRLGALAAAPGIGTVRPPVRAFPEDAGSSEGVAASGADTWQSAADTGSGVTIGIVDVGYTDLSAEQDAGHLPADTEVVNEGCTVDDQDSTETDRHGTAVAEIVHQMAPDAHLVLYCIDTSIDFAAAEADIEADHPEIRIVTSSLGFSGDSRGDGTGAQSGTGVTAAGVVRKARQAGILWIQSAGNSADNHWSGKLADADQDGYVDIDGVYNGTTQFEDDAMYLAPGTGQIDLQWDQWPTSTADITLEAYGYQCTQDYDSDGDCAEEPIDPDAAGHPIPLIDEHLRDTAPTAGIPLENDTAFDQIWVVDIVIGPAAPTTRYDLTYQGDTDGPSALACAGVVSGRCVIAARAYQGSISEPAGSPYALAVGAAFVGSGDSAAGRGTLESFSSQGPTIDARTKPDIAAWDGTSSFVYGGAFFGTSAAAPHVAGAAALVQAADPGLDAAQLQYFLEQRASSSVTDPAPLNPPTNALGHGLLTLGPTPVDTPVTAAPGSGYRPITPKEILDTRTTIGGHHAKLGAAATLTLTVPGLPTDASAVAVNLTGVRASAAVTYLSAYAYGTAFTRTSNLALTRADPSAGVFAIVPVRQNRIVIRNNSGTVDVVVHELGYFGTGSEPGRYSALSRTARVLDTRTTTGNHHAKLADRKTVTVAPPVPATATAALVNIFVTGEAGGGYALAGPTCSSTVSTVTYTKLIRANLALVRLSGAKPSFCIMNRGPAVDVIVDVVGYMGPSGSLYRPLPAASTIVDTRTGNGGSAGQHPSRPFGARTTTTFYGSNVGDVPAGATALFTGVVEAQNTGGIYLSLFPGTSKPAGTQSALNFSPGRVVANAAVVGLAGNRFGAYNGAGSTHAAIYLLGYFA